MNVKACHASMVELVKTWLTGILVHAFQNLLEKTVKCHWTCVHWSLVRMVRRAMVTPLVLVANVVQVLKAADVRSILMTVKDGGSHAKMEQHVLTGSILSPASVWMVIMGGHANSLVKWAFRNTLSSLSVVLSFGTTCSYHFTFELLYLMVGFFTREL